MSTQVGIIPKPGEINAHIWAGAGDRMRVVRFGGDATLHVKDRYVLEALQAALDEIRADMDAETAEAVAS